MKDSFYEIAVGLAANAGVRASAQKTLIDSLTETSPILASIPVEKANRSNANIFERLVSTDVVGIVDLDAPLPEMNSQGQLDHVNLSKFGGKVIIPCDKATELGGRDAYLGQKLPPIMRASGNSAERSIYYNNMLAAAIKYKNVQSATASPSGNNYCSIVAVTWTTGETTGLLSPLPYEVGTDNAGLRSGAGGKASQDHCSAIGGSYREKHRRNREKHHRNNEGHRRNRSVDQIDWRTGRRYRSIDNGV